jgi:hypothetical protein
MTRQISWKMRLRILPRPKEDAPPPPQTTAANGPSHVDYFQENYSFFTLYNRALKTYKSLMDRWQHIGVVNA